MIFIVFLGFLSWEDGLVFLVEGEILCVSEIHFCDMESLSYFLVVWVSRRTVREAFPASLDIPSGFLTLCG